MKKQITGWMKKLRGLFFSSKKTQVSTTEAPAINIGVVPKDMDVSLFERKHNIGFVTVDKQFLTMEYIGSHNGMMLLESVTTGERVVVHSNTVATLFKGVTIKVDFKKLMDQS